MTIKALYPNVRPTLNLDFAKTKALDPRITFTRASTATFVGADGLIKTAASGAPRFDHNPATGESLGLLVEEARTNYLQPSVPDYSGGFGTWTNGLAPLSANAGTAPDGTNTAVLTAWNTVSGGERMYYSTGTPTSPGITEIHSFFVKPKTPGAGDKFVVTFQGANWSWLNGLSSTKLFYFDFDTQTLSANTGTGYQTTVTALANGWYRISIPAVNNGVGGFNTYVAINRNVQVGNWYIWGCQRENGTFPTSYIPTVASTVTRAADVASMTGTNFSSWYRQDEGSFLAKVKALSPTFQQSIFRAKPASGTSEMRIHFSGSSALSSIYSDAGSGSGGSTPTSIHLPYSTSFAAAYKLLDFAVVNATQVVTNTTGGVAISPVFTQAHIGSMAGQFLSGTIDRLTYYPVRLPNAQLQALTAT